MKIDRIQYQKVFNLGDYQNEKIGIEIVVNEGDDPVECHMEAVRYVEKAHNFQKMMPDYKRAHQIVNSPMTYTGYQVEQARATIEEFETEFPDFITAYRNVAKLGPLPDQQP